MMSQSGLWNKHAKECVSKPSSSNERDDFRTWIPNLNRWLPSQSRVLCPPHSTPVSNCIGPLRVWIHESLVVQISREPAAHKACSWAEVWLYVQWVEFKAILRALPCYCLSNIIFLLIQLFVLSCKLEWQVTGVLLWGHKAWIKYR